MTVGSRAEVFHGNATQTSGGLTKKDLKMKDGRIISKAASKASKKSYKKTAFKAFVDAAKAKSKALWNYSVKEAKDRLNIDRSKFVRVQGKLLKEAQEIYHILLTKPTRRVKSKK